MGFFERFLTIWVLICIGVGILLGKLASGVIEPLTKMTVFEVNIPIAVLVWLMIYPMMVQIDFSSVKDIGKNPKGLFLTLTVNWLIKPFTMALFGWLFFKNIFSAFITPDRANEYLAGVILLGAAPCTAMVFVWSYLTKGNPLYTLVQVSINDLVILFAFIPIVGFLLGISDIVIPYNTLLYSVLIFVVIPLFAGYISRKYIIVIYGKEWFETKFLHFLKPISISALLVTLVLLFAFQGNIILMNPFDILLIAIPLTIQTYFIFAISWTFGRFLNLPHNVCAPASMIGASNFFELSVAVAIALFGINSGAALATVVGVLIEVPVMLSLVKLANRWRY